MKEMTRQEVIDALIQKDIDGLKDGNDGYFDYIKETLEFGFDGFNKYTNENLINEYERDCGERVEIIDGVEKGVKKVKYMHVEEAIKVFIDYLLRDADLDTIMDILQYGSDAEVFIDAEDSDGVTCEVTITEEYNGIFYSILRDERGY